MTEKDQELENFVDAEYEEGEFVDDEDSSLIELLDEDGNTVNFRLVDVMEYKGKKYCFLLPAEEVEGFDEGEVLIFELNEETQTLETIDDDALVDEVFEAFLAEEE